MDNAELHIIKGNFESQHDQALTAERKVTISGIENPQSKFDQSVPNINLKKLENFFGLETPNTREQNILKDIYSYFDKKGVKSMNEMYKYINNMERKMIPTPIGMDRIMHFWNYLKIFSEAEEYNSIKQSFEK